MLKSLDHFLIPRRILEIWLLFLALTLSACSPAVLPEKRPAVSTLRVVMDNNYPPYVFQDAQGNPQGILIDQWKLWEQRTGVKVEITALPWGEALERMKAGDFDVIDTIFYTAERSQVFDFTDPHVQINVRIFFQNKISGIAQANDLKGFRVAVKKGDANVDSLLQRGVTDLTYYDSYEEIVQAAKQKEETIFVIDQPPALYFLYKYGLQEQFNYSEPIDVNAFHRAVKKGNKQILDLVMMGFSKITKAEYQAIDTRWFGSGQISSLQQIFPYLALGVATASLIILGLFTFNRMLQSRVRARTLELQDALNSLQKSETRFREAIEFFPVPVSIANNQGRILSVNRKFLGEYGYSLEDIPSMADWMSRAYPDPEYRAQALSQWNEDIAEALKSGTSTTLREYKVTCKDGSKRDVEIVMHPIGDLWVASFNNVTERKQAGDALRENRRFLADLIEYGGALIFVKDRGGRYELINRKWEEVTGLKREIVIGNTDENLFPGVNGKQFRANDLEVIESGHVIEKEEILDGEVKRYFISIKFPVRDEDGHVKGMCGITTEITDRKRAEEALRESEVNYRNLVDLSPDAIIVHSDGKVVFANPSAVRMIHARDVSEILGMSAINFVHPDMRAMVAERIKKMQDTNSKSAPLEEKFICLDGTIIDVEVVAMPIHYEGLPAIQTVIRDITERKQMVDILKASEEKYRTLIETVNVGIFISTLDGKFLQANSAVLKMTGYADIEEFLQIPAQNLYVDILDRQWIGAELQKHGFVKDVEFRSLRKDGTQYWISLSGVLLKNHNGEPDSILGSVIDITERKRSAEVIQQSEKRFRTLIENSADALTLLSADGSVIYEGPTVKRLTGYSVDERLGKSSFENIFSEDLPKLKSIWADLLASPNTTVTLEFRSIRKDGSIWWTDGTATNLLNDVSVQAIVVNYRDVTQRKQAEEALQKSNERNRAIVAALPDLLFEISADGRFLDCIATDPERLLVPREQALGRLAEELLPADVAALTMERIRQTLADGAMQVFEYSLNFRPTTQYFESRMTRLGPDSVLALVRDITAAKRIEQALRQSEQRYRTLFEQANDAIFVETLDDQILDVNQHACQMLGYTHDELLHMKVSDLIAPEIQRKRQTMRHELSEYGRKPFESLDVRKDGVYIPVEVTNSILPDGLALSIVRDITERKRTEDALRKSEAEVRSLNIELEKRVVERTAQLEMTNKELEAFSYSVSHDLRAPLRAIDGFSKIILEDYTADLNAEAQKLLGHVRAESQHMAQLIDALLNLSRMSRAEIREETVDLSSLVHQVLDGLRQSQPDRQVECLVAENISARGDARLLNVALENLLGNAWKFTSRHEQAYIEFGTLQGEDELIYFVRDNGAGFDPAYTKKLFGAFQRLHRADEFEGTGIGLATVQRIVSRHGGRVWAEAEIGKGATFYFTLG